MTTSIAEYSPTEAALTDLRSRYKDAVYDVTTRTGLAEAKEARAELRGWRTALEDERKRIKAPALKRCQEIDAEAKRITKELTTLEDPIDAVIKLEEGRKEAERKAKEEAAAKAEAERIAKAEAAVAAIRAPLLGMVGRPASVVVECIKSIEAIDTATYEFPTEAMAAKDETLARLDELYASAVKQEADRKRVEEERAALAIERARIEAERPIAPLAPDPAHRTLDEAVILAQEYQITAARESLAAFVRDFGHLNELQSIVAEIKTYLEANHAS